MLEIYKRTMQLRALSETVTAGAENLNLDKQSEKWAEWNTLVNLVSLLEDQLKELSDVVEVSMDKELYK